MKCNKRAESKQWCLAEEEGRAVTSRVFIVYRQPINMALYFKDLGRVILAVDDEFPAVIQNLTKAQTVFLRISKIFSREETRPGFFLFYRDVVQSVFLFYADTLLVTPCTGLILGGYQYQVARQLMRWLPRWRFNKRWEYTSAEVVREEMQFETI